LNIIFLYYIKLRQIFIKHVQNVIKKLSVKIILSFSDAKYFLTIYRLCYQNGEPVLTAACPRSRTA